MRLMDEDFVLEGFFTYDVEDYALHVGKHSFGFSEVSWSGLGSDGEKHTVAHMGAFGEFRVPVSACDGWALVFTVPLILITAAIARL